MDLLGREVIAYKCPYSASGLAVGETHNTLLLLIPDRGKVVTIPKAVCYFFIKDLGVLVNGIYLVGYRDRRLFSCGMI
ncbi:MAG: hypothetical protein LM577_04375 [Thermoproteaceae archaeon]|nr:hypothetical protein [Thermoproteaceae archaeon]